ncbi:hypothetical protein ACJMK2_040897 [Sinanodonta woodiana]|uniref:PLAT domain-containing protein n=1 Tax=Sinanodonta woodiana TaxID=1069815 RepID=A0ABD3W2F5_SINWO
MVDANSMGPKLIIFLVTVGLVTGKAVRNEKEASVHKRSTVCYGDLGCFGTNTPFFSLQRPINFLPAAPAIIDTKFRLFTRHNMGDTSFQMLRANDYSSIRSSHFNSSNPTKMVVHGFIENGLVDWMKTMKNELLKAGDFNVILIDWGKGSGLPYTQATANTRVVGAETAKLITTLKEQVGANPEDFHIIGHSLGAHISGYAGERLLNLGRITGYGMIQPVGHVDYYPNSGMNQPGCDKDPITTLRIEGDIYNGVKQFVACNHLRSYDYFTESINSACPFEGYRCNSYDDFKRGVCMPCSDGGCGYMGFHADRVKPPAGTTNVKYFLDTGDSKPFCRYHYQIKVSFASVSGSRSERGKLTVNLMGSNGQLGEKVLTNDYMDIDPGKTYGFVLTSTHDLGTVNRATLSWHHSSSVLDVTSWNILNIRHPSIYIQKLEIVSGETKNTFNFCGQNAKIETDQTKLLTTMC